MPERHAVSVPQRGNLLEQARTERSPQAADLERQLFMLTYIRRLRGRD